jgi:hypothetical protein
VSRKKTCSSRMCAIPTTERPKRSDYRPMTSLQSLRRAIKSLRKRSDRDTVGSCRLTLDPSPNANLNMPYAPKSSEHVHRNLSGCSLEALRSSNIRCICLCCFALTCGKTQASSSRNILIVCRLIPTPEHLNKRQSISTTRTPCCSNV